MTERNPNGQFKSKSPPVLRTLGERIDSLEASLISREEAASIRRDLAKVMTTENEQISLNQVTQTIDDEQRKQIAELEQRVNRLGKRIDSVDVSDTRITQLGEKCDVTEKQAGLALLASAVLGIVAIVLAYVL